MKIKNNITDQPADFHQNNENEAVIENKFDELVDLISVSDISDITARDFRVRFNNAIRLTLDPLEALGDTKIAAENADDDFSILLQNKRYRVKLLKKIMYSGGLARVILLLISLTLIVLGYGMIIMPAPPFFEMFTIFYFNNNDGITIMDCISLLVILSGVYFFIRASFKKPTYLKKSGF